MQSIDELILLWVGLTNKLHESLLCHSRILVTYQPIVEIQCLVVDHLAHGGENSEDGLGDGDKRVYATDLRVVDQGGNRWNICVHAASVQTM